MHTLFLQRVGRKHALGLTIAIDMFALRDTFACYNSLLKTKSLFEQKTRWRMYSTSGSQPSLYHDPL